LRVIVGPVFFAGMALITIPLFVFSWASLRRSKPPDQDLPAESR
jgi:hypothetical protein